MSEENIMKASEDDSQEYVVFTVEAQDGTEVEMAVIDEFDYNGKHYAVTALVEGEEISEDGVFIYGTKADGEDYALEKITDEEEYSAVAQAYTEME